MTQLSALLLKIMMILAPIQHHSYYENQNTTINRYTSIANDIAEVVPNEINPFDNDPKKIKISILLIIIGSQEGNEFGASVDKCIQNGDHGTSFTIFQLSNAYAPSYQICHDRKIAIHWAIKAITQSFEACKRQGFPYYSRLSIYSTGHCVLNEKFSVNRLRKLDKLLKDYATDIAAF